MTAQDPTGRFTGLAQTYARCRPTYPEEALDFIVQHCGLRPGSRLVDVGCGTGISARQLARRWLAVLGIEPNADMRAQAQAELMPPGLFTPTYLEGRAEATGLAAARADGVLAAQAFHWFDREAALAEFHRILKPAGWVILMWNERDEADAFTAAYGAVVRSSLDAGMIEATRAQAGEILLQSSLFRNAQKKTFGNVQELDEEGIVGRAMSVSYAPREQAAIERFAADLRKAFAQFQRAGKATLCYTTTVYVAQKP